MISWTLEAITCLFISFMVKWKPSTVRGSVAFALEDFLLNEVCTHQWHLLCDKFFPFLLDPCYRNVVHVSHLGPASASLRKEWMLSSSSLMFATFLWIPSNNDASWDNNRIKCCITSLTALSAISLPLIDLTTRLWARPLIWLQMIERFYSLNCLKDYWSTNKGGIETGLDSMSGWVLERVWLARICRRRRRNGKVMVLFLGYVDFEVVDDVGIGSEKNRLWVLSFTNWG